MTTQGTQPPSSDQKSSASDNASSSAKEKGVHASRRKLITGLAATPVIMTLASRPALARNFCSISGWGSVHPSGRPEGHTCEGRSPGYWKTYWSSTTPDDWGKGGFNPGPLNPLNVSNQWDHDYSVPTIAELNAAVADPNNPFSSTEKQTYITAIGQAATLDTLMGTTPGTWSPPLTSAHAGTLPIAYPTVMQIFHDNDYKQGLSPGNAAFHYAAALLNAAAWGESFGYTPTQMRTLITDKHGTAGFVESLNWLHHHGYDSENPNDP